MNKSNLILIEDSGKKKTSELLADLKKLFPVWSYYSDDDLDRDFPPVQTKHQFRNTQEPDEDTASQSAEDLAKTGKEYMTLRERLIFEALWFKKHKAHLDEKYITLCAGSRARGGSVPGVGWVGDGLHVCWCSPRGAGGRLRARAAVSLPSSLSPSYPLDEEVIKL